MRIERYTSEKAEEWNRFVALSKNGTFLFDRGYMDYHADRFEDHSLRFYLNNRLLALLPANRQGSTLYSHQGLTYGGLVVNEQATTAQVVELFRELYDSLLTSKYSRPDQYFILADFKSYADAHRRVEEAYRDSSRWARMAMMNTACSGKFTSDRTIQQYVDEIWHLDHVEIKVDPQSFE